MLESIRKTIRNQYKTGKMRKRVVYLGVGIMIGLIFLCYLEIKKESLASAWYEKTLYQATSLGRWLKYGQYEPETLYQRTFDKISVLHFARVNALERRSMNSEIEEVHNEADQTWDATINNSDRKEESSQGETQGSLDVRYAYGTVLPLQKQQEERPAVEQSGQQGQHQQVGNQQLVTNNAHRSVNAILSTVKEQYRWKEATEQTRFLKNYYIADVSVGNVSSVIDGEKLLSMETSLKTIKEEPQILIYHTHGTEGYCNSRAGIEADTVVGMGDILCEELSARGFSVIHDRTTYDFVNGKDNRDYAYTTARPEIEALLEEYPSIEVILDIHRDSGAARTTTIDGESVAQLMLFNGLCRNADGPISYLPNSYLDATLAFSLQLNLLGRERYPGLMYKIYLKNYRYNMHFTGHCMLVELGTQNNTVEEAKNGVRYLAELLYELLTE